MYLLYDYHILLYNYDILILPYQFKYLSSILSQINVQHGKCTSLKKTHVITTLHDPPPIGL